MKQYLNKAFKTFLKVKYKNPFLNIHNVRENKKILNNVIDSNDSEFRQIITYRTMRKPCSLISKVSLNQKIQIFGNQ